MKNMREDRKPIISIQRIIDWNCKSSDTVDRSMRVSLLILGPIFILIGLGGMLGIFDFETTVNGVVVEGKEEFFVNAIFFISGLLIIIFRFTWLKNKQE